VVPVATTVNVAAWPAATVSFEGCVVIEGATAAAFTVSIAVLLVAEPAALLTTASKVDPLSAVAVAAVV